MAGFIEELIENASHPKYEDNKKQKHNNDAYMGWKKFLARFTIETFDVNRNRMILQKYICIVVVRCPNHKELYLYDIVGIKKEADKSQ